MLAGLLANKTPITSLAGLVGLPKLRALVFDDGALISLGTIELLSPAILSVMRDPLDAEALATIARLCQAGWVVSWDGGNCGDICKLDTEYCIDF
jgi:hypothetical protein